MTEIGRIGIVGGAGWLGTAIARALVAGGIVPLDRLTCSFRTARPADALDCTWTRDNRALGEGSDIIILSVRPDDWQSVEIDARGKLVVSVMAGVTIDDIAKRTGSDRVARALPNAAAEIGYSYTPYFLASSRPDDAGRIAALFGCCGLVDQVHQEEHIDYFTAMSGSGAAFPALLADALARDAIGRGVPAAIAVRAAQQLLVGAGRLQERSGDVPADTVKAFVDYRGTTAAGIVAMREAGFDEAVGKGLEAAFRKARALSER